MSTRLLGRVENPALQKAEIEWKTAVQAADPLVALGNSARNKTRAPTASSPRVTLTICQNRRLKSRAESFWKRESCKAARARSDMRRRRRVTAMAA